MVGKAVDLEDICISSKIILLDTSAILGTYEIPNSSRRTKINHAEDSIKYFTKKMDIIYNLLVTEEIYSELSGFKFPSKSQRDRDEYCPHRELEFQNEKQKLTKKIGMRGNILKLSRREKDLYEDFYDRYQKRKERRHLSNPDYNLAISAMACAKNKQKISIISNDDGIKGIWHDFVDLEYFGKNINFFNHVTIGKFKKMRQYE